MRINFYSSFHLTDITGGSIYNRYLLEWLQSEYEETNFIHIINPEETLWQPGDFHFIDGPLCKYAPPIGGGKSLVLMHLPVFEESRNVSLQNHEKSFLQSVDLIIVPSLIVKQKLVKIYQLIQENVVVIPPGISSTGVSKTAYSVLPQRIICGGNFNTIKNHLGMIQLFSEFKNLEWTLDIFGKGELENQVGMAIENAGMKDKVFIREPVQHVDFLTKILDYDLAVNYSSYETYGMFMRECLNVGLPLLTTSVGWIQHESYLGVVKDSTYKDRLSRLLVDTGAYKELIDDSVKYIGRANRWNFSPLKAWMSEHGR